MLKKICLILFLYFFLFLPKVDAASITYSSGTQQITVNDEFKVSVSLSVNAPDGREYFLSGLFHKTGSSNYCGFTWNGNDWFSGPYSSNEGWKNFLKVSITDDSWSGELRAKIDPDDSGCSGSGTYEFKIRRFTEGGSKYFDSQTALSVEVVVPTPTPTPTNTPTPTKTPTPSLTSTKIPTTVNTIASTSNVGLVAYGSSPILEPSGLKSNTGKTYKRFSTSTPGSVLGKGSDSINGLKDNSDEMTEESKDSSWKAFVIGGVAFIISACGILLYRKYKDRKEDEFQL